MRFGVEGEFEDGFYDYFVIDDGRTSILVLMTCMNAYDERYG